MVDPLRVSPGGGGREQSWRILPVLAEPGVVQAALGCQVSPSIPCDFTGNCRMGWGARMCQPWGFLAPQYHFPGHLVLFERRLTLPQFPQELERGVYTRQPLLLCGASSLSFNVRLVPASSPTTQGQCKSHPPLSHSLHVCSAAGV